MLRYVRLISALAGLALPAVASAQFSFQALAGIDSAIVRISADGQTVVGQSNGQAVRWTAAGGVVALGDLPGGATTSRAYGVSSDGTVIVGAAGSANGWEAFRWTASGGIVGLGDLSSNAPITSDAIAVSADGTVVAGYSRTTFPILRAFRWTASTGMTALGSFASGDGFSTAFAITPDGNVIAGSSRNQTGEEAFIWTAQSGLVPLGVVPGGSGTRAFASSADGRVVVGMANVPIGFEAFRWTAETGAVGLGSLDPNDFGSSASSVSADGNVVTGVGSGSADLAGEAFVWFPAAGMLNLRQYLLSNGVSAVQGWRLVDGASVSADGRTIVGTGIDPLGNAAAWIARIEIIDAPPPPPADVTETLSPNSVSLLAGTLVSGGVTQLQTSNNSHLRLRATGTNRMQVSITGQASRAAASELRFSVEASATGSITSQQIALFDFTNNSWETLSQITASTSDNTVEVSATNQPARFIEPGTLRVRARVTFVPSGGRRVTTQAQIDRVFWTRVP